MEQSSRLFDVYSSGFGSQHICWDATGCFIHLDISCYRKANILVHKNSEIEVIAGSQTGNSNIVSLKQNQGTESMTSRAYSRLRDDIISGALKPGKKLKIEELRAHYDVGTSPIREALSLLTSDHFVERIDQRGFKVAAVSVREFDELLNTRCWLEERALRESIKNGKSGWEEQVVLAAYRLSRVPRSETDEQFVANVEWEVRHKHFHMTLISACESSFLLKFCDQLYDQNVRYRQLSGKKAYPKRDVTAEHGAICDAVLARDADVATELLVGHYVRTGNFLKDQIEG